MPFGMSPKIVEKQLSCNKVQKSWNYMLLVIKDKSILEVLEGSNNKARQRRIIS